MRTSIIAGVAVVHAMSENAAAAGVEVGDQLVSVDGQPALQVLWDIQLEDDLLEDGVESRYVIEKPDGSRLVLNLEPVPAADVEKLSDVLLHLGLLLVSSLYLGNVARVKGLTFYIIANQAAAVAAEEAEAAEGLEDHRIPGS